MNDKGSKLKNEIEKLEERKVLLIQAVGKENFGSIVDVLNQQIKKHNLDTTPNILRDLFDYIVKVECINKNIYEKTAPESLVQELDLEEYFRKAFWEMYKMNECIDIKPEQYAKNIEIMLKINDKFFI